VDTLRAVQRLGRCGAARAGQTRGRLDGYRGAPPGDREALIALLRRVSALVESVPELQEFDLNPVKVLAPGAGVMALDGRMRLAAARLRCVRHGGRQGTEERGRLVTKTMCIAYTATHQPGGCETSV